LHFSFDRGIVAAILAVALQRNNHIGFLGEEKMKMKNVCLLAASSAVFAVSSAFASPVPWTTPAGSTPYYDYADGQSQNGLFGDPLVLDSSFVFFPNNFKAVSLNGVAASKSDSLTFEITVKNNQAVTGLTVNEIGDYSISGTGTVSVGGSLTITNLAVAQPPTQSPLISTPASPITTTTSAIGSWTATSTATNLPDGWTKFHVNLTNILDATSLQGSTATIEKKLASAAIEVSFIVPEPTSLSLLAAGATMLLRRRRNG